MTDKPKSPKIEGFEVTASDLSPGQVRVRCETCGQQFDVPSAVKAEDVKCNNNNCPTRKV